MSQQLLQQIRDTDYQVAEHAGTDLFMETVLAGFLFPLKSLFTISFISECKGAASSAGFFIGGSDTPDSRFWIVVQD